MAKFLLIDSSALELSVLFCEMHRLYLHNWVFQFDSSFIQASILKNWAYKQNDAIKRWYTFRQNYPRLQQSTEKIVASIGTNLFQISECLFVDFFLRSWRFYLSKTNEESNAWLEFQYCSRTHFAVAKSKNMLISTRNPVFKSLVGISRNEKLQIDYIWLRIEQFEPKGEKVFLNAPRRFTIYWSKIRVSS